MEGHLLMSRKERERVAVLAAVKAGSMVLSEAGEALGLSRRQMSRIYGRYCREGDAGLVHRSRGKKSNRRKSDELRELVLARYKERYYGFGPTLAAEKLAEEGLEVDHETLRRWLLAKGEWKRQRKRDGFRQRRERRAHFGELIQLDGSHHRWFGPDHPECCIMQFIDDATGERLAIMAAEETSEAAMLALLEWVNRYGIPRALYMDRKSVFYTDREPTLEEQLRGEIPLSQFGKVCQRLGIELIFANSPQAKGRIERAHGVLQDRFVKELALEGITGIDDANRLLHNGFMTTINQKMARLPREKKNYHRKVPKHMDLADVFCFEETRQLNNDWTVRYRNRFYQVHRSQSSPKPKPKDKIAVRTRLDGSLYLAFQEKPLRFSVCAEPPARASATDKASKAPSAPRGGKRKPDHNHPWRRRTVQP